jgi:nitrous oxide reductase accessory protein NosL
MKRSLTAVVAMLMLAACGSSPVSNAVTPASVSVQPSDVPSGMQRCDVSGGIETYLNNIKTKDPTTYASTKTQWDAAQQHGATAAQVAFYTDSVANCANVASKASSINSATYKLVVNFAIQFKDEASAAAGYTSGSIFGIDRSTLKAGGAPVTEGIKTGLGANSLVLSTTIANQSFYIAVWQNKAFMVILGIINTDAATGEKVATAVNNRIK